MNRHNRKELNEAIVLLERAGQIIEDIKTDEESKLENMPDNLSNTPAAVTLEDAFNYLDEIDIQDAVDSINNAIEGC